MKICFNFVKIAYFFVCTRQLAKFQVSELNLTFLVDQNNYRILNKLTFILSLVPPQSSTTWSVFGTRRRAQRREVIVRANKNSSVRLFVFTTQCLWRFLNNTQTTIKTIAYKNVFYRSADWCVPPTHYPRTRSSAEISQRSRVPYRTRYPLLSSDRTIIWLLFSASFVYFFLPVSTSITSTFVVVLDRLNRFHMIKNLQVVAFFSSVIILCCF